MTVPPTLPEPPRVKGWGVFCAILVLAIRTGFILVSRGSATRALGPLDIAWLRFVLAGLAVPLLGGPLGAATLGALVCVTLGLLLGVGAFGSRRTAAWVAR